MTPPYQPSTFRKLLPAYLLVAMLVVVPLALWMIPANQNDPLTLTSSEARATRVFDNAVHMDEPRLYAFLRNMPKGGDLHLHLTGAVYAESFIREAVADHLCVDAATTTLEPNKGMAGAGPVCAAGQFPAAKALSDQTTWDAMINAFSLRSFFPRQGFSEHDQFFSTFNRFMLPATVHGGEWVDEVAARAASQNEQYVEIMHLPATGAVLGLAAKVHWTGGSDARLAQLKSDAEAAGLASVVAAAKAETDGMDASRNQLEHCGTAQATPACGVTVRYIFGVLRDFTPEQIFVQTLVGYELTKVDPEYVAVNYLRAEDWRGAIDEYATGMRILQWMRPQYPDAHLSLHAGELTEGVVPPEDLRDHIRQAVEIAGAERIGHGVDIGYENDATGLLREMARKRIMVEINLTSNDAILGVKGDAHPLAMYMAAHVPIALSTDDEGVSRIDITHEYVKAVEEQGLSYVDLKQAARTSIEHSFLPGESLWQVNSRWPERFLKRNSACEAIVGPSTTPSDACRKFLAGSEKATQQYELERRFAVFEANIR